MNIKNYIKYVVYSSLFFTTLASAGTTGNLIINPSFDDSSVSFGSFQYNTDSSFWSAGWLFNKSWSGIANNSVAWGGAAEFTTVALLQGVGSVTQFVNSDASDFTISFELAQRGSYGIGFMDVYWDNQLIAENLSPASALFQSYNFDVKGFPGTQHVLSFRGQAVEGQDTSVFLDNVVVKAIY